MKLLRFRDKSNTSVGHAPDWPLIAAFSALIIFGLMVLTSAGSALGYQKFGDSYYFIKHQFVLGILPGLAMLLFFVKLKIAF